MVIRTTHSPLRWLVGLELARQRSRSRLSLLEASRKIGMSKPKLGHLETGRQHQDPDDIAMVLEAYGVGQDDIDRLIALSGRADEAMWWAPWEPVVPDWLQTFVGLEGMAEREFVFEPIMIPGILQTPDYAHAVTNHTPRVRRDHSGRFVDLRMARTNLLKRTERPLALHAVLAEGALRLRVGSPELHRAQLEHLIAMAELPTATIQVLRPEDGLHTAVSGQFVILHFDTAHPIAYTELHDGAIYLQEENRVRTYTMVAENLESVALGPDESVALIKSMARS